jgi:hypothetical protein
MNNLPARVAKAQQFVSALELPDLIHPHGAELLGGAREVSIDFTDAKNQAAIVGSEIISFVKGVTAERRQDITNCALLAQLVANKRVSDGTRIYDWYDQYFEVLSNIGWLIQEKTFATYEARSDNLEVHEAILQVATSLLGPATATLTVVKATLDALKAMSADSPWITLFNREVQHANTAHFQVSLAHENEDGQFLVSLMAFGLEAKASVTQVLFFKFRSTDVKLRRNSGSVTIATDVLAGIRPKVIEKISGIAADYIKQLPDLG